jgi:putative transposase
MRKSRFSEEQMVEILREADRTSVAAAAKKNKISEQTIYVWRQHFARLDAAIIVRQMQARDAAVDDGLIGDGVPISNVTPSGADLIHRTSIRPGLTTPLDVSAQTSTRPSRVDHACFKEPKDGRTPQLPGTRAAPHNRRNALHQPCVRDACLGGDHTDLRPARRHLGRQDRG